MGTAVYKIDSNNMNRKWYLDAMNSWNSEYEVQKDSLIYAIAYGERILAGASVRIYDGMVKIVMLNNSICHADEIQAAAMPQLTNLIDQEYGRMDKVVQYVKRK